MRSARFILACLTAGACCAALALAGCETFGFGTKKEPPPHEYELVTPYAGPRTFAIAPTINLSGSRDFDPLTVSDQVFKELHQVSGLDVLPVDKTLIAMEKNGIRVISTPDAAQRIADGLGVDGVIVPVVTSYDPYRPPVMGMTLQLYTGHQAELALGAAPPNEPQARNVSGQSVGPPLAPAPQEMPIGSPSQPVSQVSAVFNASNQAVLIELRDFARGRTNYESALQEEEFLADMDAYTRFVAHAMVRRLTEVERARVAGR